MLMPRVTLTAVLLIIGTACAKKEEGKPVEAGQLAVSLTEKGFEPDRIRIRKGEVLSLVVTRRTETGCARDFVLDEAGINEPLPLNGPVTIKLKLDQTGELKFGCAMGKMVNGTIIVE